MPWIQISFNSSRADAVDLSESLSSLGAVSVTFQDAADEPILEPGVGETPLWQHTTVTALFEDSVSADFIIRQLADQLAPKPLPAHFVNRLDDRVWEREWMKDFHAMQFGTRTWICPSWQTPPDPHAVNIMLDPGLAFGTGTHPTTAMCLEWLDENIHGGEVVIDFGCGSGILAICALLHGASKVYAIDNDPQALSATRENAVKNQVIDRLEILPADKSLAIKADIVVANILAHPLAELAVKIAKITHCQGMAVLSGILLEQQQLIADAYRPWYELEHVARIEQWVRLDLKRGNDTC